MPHFHLVEYLIRNTQHVSRTGSHALAQADALKPQNQNSHPILRRKKIDIICSLLALEVSQWKPTVDSPAPAKVVLCYKRQKYVTKERKNYITKDRRVCCNYSLPKLTVHRVGWGRKEWFLSLKKEKRRRIKKTLNFDTKIRSSLGKCLWIPVGLWCCCGLVLYT